MSATVWKQRLRSALVEAMRWRDADAVSSLRQAVSALDQAEATPGLSARSSAEGPFAGSEAGLGATEAPRRELSDAEARAVLEREQAERATAMEALLRLGQHDAAAALERQSAALVPVLAAQ